jgi:PAS domain-containing protein
LEWLARHAGVRRSVCLAVDAEANLLVGIAGYGVASEDVGLFAWPLSDPQDALVGALAAPESVTFKASRVNGHPGRVPPATPLGAGTFTAIPLRGVREAEEGGLGLLLVRQSPGSDGDIAWAATVLGQKIEQIRGRGSLAEEVRKLRRERALFFTIINAVTDPILLTDTEGRLIVANSRAEKLFAAS